MVKENRKQDNNVIIEQRDIFFFYRPKVDTEEVEDIEDVQRFYMIMVSEEEGKDQCQNQKQKQKDLQVILDRTKKTTRSY